MVTEYFDEQNDGADSGDECDNKECEECLGNNAEEVGGSSEYAAEGDR